MNESTFWEIIHLFDWSEEGDDDAVIAPACEALAAQGEQSIFKFADILAEKLHALDTRKHCKACYAGELDPDNGNDYISADGFLYARCVVVANGRDFYAKVLADPTQFPQEMEFEALLSLADMAYEQKTGDSMDHVSPVDFESFQNQEGWAPTENTQTGNFTGPGIPPGNRRLT